MKTAKLSIIAAGLTAIAACNVNVNENNTANADDNAGMNAADTTLPPADLNADMNDVNVGTTNDVENDMNAMNNSADNSSNGY